MDPYRAAPAVNYGYDPAQATWAKDQQDLKVLSILHFVYAGVIALSGLLIGLYLVIGAAFLASSASAARPKAGEAAMMGTVVLIVFGSVLFFLVLHAALLIYSGLSLRNQERKLLSQIVAAWTCLNVPFGTALGVYTLVVLSRPSVSMLYVKNRAA
jgi:hypothetical protein